MSTIATFQFPEALSNFSSEIEKTDDDGSLQVYSYKQIYGSDAKVKASPEVLKLCRGVIFDGQQCVVRSIGSTPELSVAEWTTFMNDETNKNKPFTFFPSYEGTLIRVFHYKKWYVSTHRKLDSHRSRWGSSKSFGEMFDDALSQQYHISFDELSKTLNENHVYLFLIGTNEHTRMVCKAPKPSVIHVGTLLNREVFTLNEHTMIRKPESINPQVELTSFVEALDPSMYQGVIAFGENGEHFKIMNSHYAAYAQVRGNDPSVMFRYLKVRNNATNNRVMFDLYPDNRHEFIMYENYIYNIGKKIHAAYVDRFINKNEVTVSQEEYRIIRQCHSFHIKDRQNNKVTLPYVLSVLSMPEYVSTVNTIIKHVKNPEKYALHNKKTETETQPVTETATETETQDSEMRE